MTSRPFPLAVMPWSAALLLDLDGTLLDIAPTPDAVTVPTGLIETLCRLRDRLGDALAIVSGRPAEQVDALLPDVAYAVVGEHGGAIRFAPGAALELPTLPPMPPHWLDMAAALVAAHPGALLERKAHGFAVHYRLAPDAGPALERGLRDLLDGQETHRLLPAHMAFEVRPLGADKGTAVAALLQRPPFVGRVPVYVGDDVTDEDAIRVVAMRGGMGLRVAEVFGSAAGVRAWLARLAEGAPTA